LPPSGAVARRLLFARCPLKTRFTGSKGRFALPEATYSHDSATTNRVAPAAQRRQTV
jgi:hypothetical protein